MLVKLRIKNDFTSAFLQLKNGGGGSLRYIAKRLLQTIPILIGISIIIFTLVNLQPGDPYAHMMDPNLSADMREEMLEKIGYYDPLPVQYVRWLGRAIQGDLGYSIVYKAPVLNVISSRIGNTFILSLTAIMLSIIIAIPIGIITAIRRKQFIDYVATVIALMGLSIPAFFFGMLMIKWFAVDLQWLPIAGMVTAGAHLEGMAYVSDVVSHMILPTLVLALINTASLMRYTRSHMIEMIEQDFIRTARAKGISGYRVIYKHALKNCMIPIVTIISLQIPTLLSGALLTETIFIWPGIGRLNYEAVMNRDYPLIMGIVMCIAILTLAANLIADILYALIDPRIKYEA